MEYGCSGSTYVVSCLPGRKKRMHRMVNIVERIAKLH